MQEGTDSLATHYPAIAINALSSVPQVKGEVIECDSTT